LHGDDGVLVREIGAGRGAVLDLKAVPTTGISAMGLDRHLLITSFISSINVTST